MPRTTIKIRPNGNIDRRNPVTQGVTEAVLTRENLMVIGKSEPERRIKKVPGSDRYNSTSVGSSPIVSAARYYTKADKRINFFFENGKLHHIDDSGNTTELLGLFDPTAYPTFAEMRVSDTDILYFSEGKTTGMYSYDGNAAHQFNKETAVTLNFVGMVPWLDRLWGFTEDSEDLYFSVNLNPVNFTDSTDAGVIVIGAKRGSKIQQIALMNETLYVFKTDSVWVIEGRTPSTFSVREVIPDVGLAARRSLQKVENSLIGLMSDFEVSSFNGTGLTRLTYDIALGGDLTKDLIPVLNRDRMDQICSVYHNYLYRMSFVENGDTINHLEYCYSSINQTDFFTRGNDVSCYLKYDRFPDKGELVTGHVSSGRLMHQYRGLQFDNQGSTAMRIKTKTKFFGTGGARNFRARKVWLNGSVLGAAPIPIRTYIDARNAASDMTSDEYTTFGESKSNITLLNIASQDSLISRGIPRHGNSKGYCMALEIDEQMSGRDFEFYEFEIEAIVKETKRNHRVGV